MEYWVCEKHDTSGRFGECLMCKYQRELGEIKMINTLKSVKEQVRVEPEVKPEIADKEDLLIYLKYIGERLRLRDDVFINSFTKYGIVNHIITKIESSKI